MTRSPDADRRAEAARLLERADRESETIIGGTARRVGDHFAGRDADRHDPVEIWGRRVGRAFSVVLAGLLTWWLGAQLGWW